jgi:hypothetical protein
VRVIFLYKQPSADVQMFHGVSFKGRYPAGKLRPTVIPASVLGRYMLQLCAAYHSICIQHKGV